MREVWRAVPGMNWEVSNLGRVRTVRLLTPAENKFGYLKVGVRVGTAWKTATVHRLVAWAFLGECPSDCEVNHINGDKKDNRPENLEYVTKKENAANALARGAYRRGTKHPYVKLSNEQEAALLKEFQECGSWKKVSEKYGISKATVYRIVRNGGPRWL